MSSPTSIRAFRFISSFAHHTFANRLLLEFNKKPGEIVAEPPAVEVRKRGLVGRIDRERVHVVRGHPRHVGVDRLVGQLTSAGYQVPAWQFGCEVELLLDDDDDE